MIRLLTLLLLFFISSATIAIGLDCGHLEIFFINNTGHDCALQKIHITHGEIDKGFIPNIIPTGSISLPFSIQQTYSQGPRIQLSYKCQNKTFTVSSEQNYCFFSPGAISGDVNSFNNVHVEYKSTVGSYYYSLPGQITWVVH